MAPTWVRRATIAASLAVASFAVLAQNVAPAARPPVESFFRHPDVDDAKLSPSGTRVAVAVNIGERVALGVIDVHGGTAPRIVASFNDADVDNFYWVNDERLVFSIIDLTAGSGDQVYAPGLFAVDADGSALRQLVRIRRDFLVRGSGSRAIRDPLEWNHRLLAVPLGGGDDVIVGRFQYDAAWELLSVVPLRLNVVTQRVSLPDLELPAGVTTWLFDPQGEPRVGVAVRDGQMIVHWRAPGSQGWRELARFPVLNATFVPHAVDASGQLYVREAEPGPAQTAILKRFDFATGKPEAKAAVRTPGFDFRGALVFDLAPGADAPGAMLGVRVETDGETTTWLNPQLDRLQQAADAKLPGRVNRLSCGRCASDDAVVLVRSWSDREPGQFWLYRPAKSQWQLVGRVRRDIDPRAMGTLTFHRFKARDGLEIPVWVTLPAQSKTASTQRPAVVLVHGGPWVRGGHWRWDEHSQFLASRGYVVIEPEFRGSTGYGRRLFTAGWRQWGLAMVDDLADALQWAVGQGWVDKSRVCIAGASYGGYATLMGLVRYPELFRCGVAWVAPTDPRLLFGLRWLTDISDEARLHRLPTLIGDPVADADRLASAAPVEQAARIRAPLLLAYGGRDQRVPLTHGERLRAELQAAGREPEWVVYPDEGHTWLRPQNRYDFARRMERFLDEQLR